MEEKPFRYRDLGSAAYISRGKAVVSAGPLQVGGFIGWWIWLFIHIAFLTGYRNRLGAILTWWLTFTRDVRRERTFTTAQIATMRDVYTSARACGPRSACHSVRIGAAPLRKIRTLRDTRLLRRHPLRVRQTVTLPATVGVQR